MKTLALVALLSSAFSIAFLSHGSADCPFSDPPVELGAVEWQRDLDAAREQSQATGKPVLVLFQEVPGWATCQEFGSGPLSLPLMVEAIEDHFIPVLIYNNKEVDAELLKAFGEPSWNNPVVRFLDHKGTDLIPRKDGVWDTAPLAQRMVASLEKAGRDVPDFLGYVADGWQEKYRRASFAMAWYWEGEAQLGSLNGVYSTRSLWAGPKEVVHVTYDPSVIEYKTLLENAERMECTNAVYTHDEQQHELASKAGVPEVIEWKDSLETRQVQKSEQKYYLRNTILAHLPLTELQAVKMNAALTENSDADVISFLSPRQKKLLKRIQTILESDKEALSEFGFPEDQNDLIEYEQKLLARLDDLKSAE